MSRWKPCKRRVLIRKVRALDFHGPYSGSRHQYMVFMEHRLTLPSNAEYSVPQLRMLIHQVEAIMGREITAEEWDRL